MSDAYVLREVDQDWRWYLQLVRVSDGAVIADDGGEPEDKTFWRDFASVVEELNRVAGLAATPGESSC